MAFPVLHIDEIGTLLLCEVAATSLVCYGLLQIQEYCTVFDMQPPGDGLIDEDNGYTLVDEDTGQILTAEMAT